MTMPLDNPIWTQDVGTMRARWIAPDGTETVLTDISEGVGCFTTDGIGGWGAGRFEFVLDPYPRGGETVRFIRRGSARLTWPLHIWGETHMQFVERYRRIRAEFSKSIQWGKNGFLIVERPDGSGRVFECFLENGFQGEPGEGWLSANPVLTLLGPSGAWRDLALSSVKRGFSEPVAFQEPWYQISSSEVLGDTVVHNKGDLMSWPEWRIRGPFTSVTGTNNTTGESFQFTFNADSNYLFSITTDRPTVRDGTGLSHIGSLNWPQAQLWGLMPGNNNVTFGVAGAGAGTSIELVWYPQYEGA